MCINSLKMASITLVACVASGWLSPSLGANGETPECRAAWEELERVELSYLDVLAAERDAAAAVNPAEEKVWEANFDVEGAEETIKLVEALRRKAEETGTWFERFQLRGALYDAV